MVRMYEDISAEMVRELIALSATVDPRLMSEISMTMIREMKMALSGMCCFELIW